MNIHEIRRRIETEPDYINIKRFDYSLAKLLERYPEGAPNRIIAHGLAIAEQEVEEMYQHAVARLRVSMGVEL